jgi:UDP-MurNAc hydroxylase
MKASLLRSATVLLETNGLKILTDPWLVDGEYYGSWAHYPPYQFDEETFHDVDFIYISHIHPDHLSSKTMALLPRHIPVLIHAYATRFLRANIEAMGFKAVELPHNQRIHLKNNVHINILAADNCNPELCGRFFGCTQFQRSLGSTQIDSLSAIEDGTNVVVNVNDCPFYLAEECLQLIKAQYPDVDLLLTGYSGAGPYPQCFPQLNAAERDQAAAAKKLQFLKQGESFIRAVRPRYCVPFAGTYTLAGRLAPLNPYRGAPEMEEACDFYRTSEAIDHERCRCVNLASGGHLDLSTGEVWHDEPTIPPDSRSKGRYISEVLARRQLDYETCDPPPPDALRQLIPKAYERMERKRQELGFQSETRAILSLGDGSAARVTFNGGGFDYMNEDAADQHDRFVLFRMDPRLLLWLVKGPKHAHMNNAEIGSHIEFIRHPNIYEPGIYLVMCYFHA